MSKSVKFGKLLLIVVVCLALAMFMTAEAAHSHNGGVDSSHCQLCASAHIAVDTQPAWLTGYVQQLIEFVPTAEPSPRAGPIILTACIRPPPTASI